MGVTTHIEGRFTVAISKNVLIRTKDGNIVFSSPRKVGSGKLRDAKGDIARLIQARQKAGLELTKALEDAGYQPISGEETDVVDGGTSSGGIGRGGTVAPGTGTGSGSDDDDDDKDDDEDDGK